MIKWASLLFAGVLLIAPFQSSTTDWHSIATEGLTHLSLPGNLQPKVDVVIETAHISQSNPLFPVGDSFIGISEATLVKSVSITIGQESVFVWRSAFADLATNCSSPAAGAGPQSQ